VYFQMRTHHGLYDSVLEKDEERDRDRHLDLKKDKLTLTECVIALVLALTCVSMHAVFLGTYLSTYADVARVFSAHSAQSLQQRYFGAQMHAGFLVI